MVTENSKVGNTKQIYYMDIISCFKENRFGMYDVWQIKFGVPMSCK